MSEYSETFNKIASRVRGGLSHVFATAALSKPGKFFIDRAGRIAGFSYFAGDVNLGLQYLVPSVCFVLSDALFALSDFVGVDSQNDDSKSTLGNKVRSSIGKIAPFAVRSSGVALLLGTTALAYLTRNADGYGALAVSYATIAAHSLSYIFEEQFHKLAEKMVESKSKILSHVFSPLAKYPISSMAVTGLAGKAVMAYGAWASGDKTMFTSAALWALGDASVICKDQNVLKWIDKMRAKTVPTLHIG
jgi:hypothetical protein